MSDLHYKPNKYTDMRNKLTIQQPSIEIALKKVTDKLVNTRLTSITYAPFYDTVITEVDNVSEPESHAVEPSISMVIMGIEIEFHFDVPHKTIPSKTEQLRMKMTFSEGAIFDDSFNLVTEI